MISSIAEILTFISIQVGTMFSSASHPEKDEMEGPRMIQQVRQKLKESVTSDSNSGSRKHTHIVGVGGIELDNIAEVIKAGADGVAVISAISKSPSVVKDAMELVEHLNSVVLKIPLQQQ